jgi:predicted SAM-dependent methyltransferase
MKPIKLNLGSGVSKLPGYTSIDKYSSAADESWDVRLIPLDDGTVSEILAVHMVESFYRFELPDVLREWIPVLEPNGKLVVEGTDLTATMQMAQSENSQTRQWGEWGLYGNQFLGSLYHGRDRRAFRRLLHDGEPRCKSFGAMQRQ